MKSNPNSHLILPLALLTLLQTHCSRIDEDETSAHVAQQENPAIQLTEEAVLNLALETREIRPQHIRQRIRLQGEMVLDEHRLAMIPSRLSGIVENLAADVGMEVNAGASMISLSSQELADRIMGYVETERQFQASMVDLDREQKLLERQISSEEQFLKVERAYHSAMNAHAVALQRLRLLGYEESQLHAFMERPDLKDMTHYFITSPIDGEVLERYVNLGNAIEPGTLLFKVADLSQLWLTFALPMRYRDSVEIGMSVQVANASLNLKGSAEISLIEDIMDPRSRTIGIRAVVPNPDRSWMPGMPTRVEIEGLGVQVERAIEKAAVHEIDGRNVVFIEDPERNYLPQSVMLGIDDAEFVELIEGPPAGTVIVTHNSYLLKQAWENKE